MRLVWHVSCAFLLLFVVCCLLFAVGATAVFARIVREVPSSVYLPVVVVVVDDSAHGTLIWAVAFTGAIVPQITHGLCICIWNGYQK